MAGGDRRTNPSQANMWQGSSGLARKEFAHLRHAVWSLHSGKLQFGIGELFAV